MAARVAYDRLPTEQRHPKTKNLDRLTTAQLIRLMNQDDAVVISALAKSAAAVARAVNAITRCLRRNGRLFFIGAGTSGRLGVIEAAECPPTFHTPPSLVQAVIAGGRGAVFRSREGAEDDFTAGRKSARRHFRKEDAVVGIAASGVTPFVLAALTEAGRIGAQTILVTCSGTSTIPAKIRIVIPVGPEVLAGSTRLKAGTATKLVLNRLTLGTMVKLGKTYGNLMVDVRPTSRKLKARAINTLQLLTHTKSGEAAWLLLRAHNQVKVAVLMHQRRFSYPQALKKLAACDGSLRRALTH